MKNLNYKKNSLYNILYEETGEYFKRKFKI